MPKSLDEYLKELGKPPEQLRQELSDTYKSQVQAPIEAKVRSAAEGVGNLLGGPEGTTRPSKEAIDILGTVGTMAADPMNLINPSGELAGAVAPGMVKARKLLNPEVAEAALTAAKSVPLDMAERRMRALQAVRDFKSTAKATPEVLSRGMEMRTALSSSNPELIVKQQLNPGYHGSDYQFDKRAALEAYLNKLNAGPETFSVVTPQQNRYQVQEALTKLSPKELKSSEALTEQEALVDKLKNLGVDPIDQHLENLGYTKKGELQSFDQGASMPPKKYDEEQLKAISEHYIGKPKETDKFKKYLDLKRGGTAKEEAVDIPLSPEEEAGINEALAQWKAGKLKIPGRP